MRETNEITWKRASERRMRCSGMRSRRHGTDARILTQRGREKGTSERSGPNGPNLFQALFQLSRPPFKHPTM